MFFDFKQFRLMLCFLSVLTAGDALWAIEPQEVRTQFQLLSLGRTQRDLHFWDGVRDQEVLVPNGGFSKNYSTTATGKLNFYRVSEGADGSVLRRSAFSVSLPNSFLGKRIMLVVIPKGKNKGFGVYPFLYSKNRYKLNHLTVLNFNADEILLAIGDDRMRLEKGALQHISIEPDAFGGLPVKAYRSEKGEYVSRFDGKLNFGTDCQSFLFLFPVPGKQDRLGLKTLTQYAAIKPESVSSEQ